MATISYVCTSNKKTTVRVQNDGTGQAESQEMWEVQFKPTLLNGLLKFYTPNEIEAQGYTVGKVYRISFDSG